MRRKVHSKIKSNCIMMSITILFILLFSNIVVAEGDQLFIDVTNESYEEIDQIYEDEIFLVSTYTLDADENIIPQVDVTIEFDQEPYLITEDDESGVIIKAPQANTDTSYLITASKDGYASAEKTILVKNKKQLVITPEKYTVNVNEGFSIKVTDEDGKSVADASVEIQSTKNPPKSTDGNGRAWLTAPEGRDKISIIAQKYGYVDGKETIFVNSAGLGLEWLTQNQYTPIVIAIIAVILAILFVNLRQRRRIEGSSKEIVKEQTSTGCSSHGTVASTQPSVRVQSPTMNKCCPTENINMESERGAKVEEIRISRPRKEKEVIPVKTEEEAAEKAIPRKVRRRHEYDWFEGTDDVRYEIDKLTGKIDEEGADKWFEGIDDIRAKVDEKLKKKDKKKDEKS